MAIIYYELLFGNIPGRGKDDEARINDITKNGILLPRDNLLSKDSKEFLKNCL